MSYVSFYSAPFKILWHNRIQSQKSSSVDAKIKSFALDTTFVPSALPVVYSALDWRRRLSLVGFADIDAFPGQNGEILVSAIEGDFCLEVIIEANLRITLSLEHDDELVFASEKLEPDQAREQFFEVMRKRWILSGGFIQSSSTPGRRGLSVSASETLPVKMAACL